MVNIVFWPPIPYSTSATPPPSPVQPREVLPKECSSHCLGTLYKVSRQLFRLYNSLFSQKRIGKKCIKTSATNLLHGGVHRPAATMGGGECSLPTLYSRLDIVVPSFAYRILSIYRLNHFVLSASYILVIGYHPVNVTIRGWCETCFCIPCVKGCKRFRAMPTKRSD